MSVIVTVTLNPSVDRNATVDNVISDAKLRCHDVQSAPGGGGINVAKAVVRLGGEALALWSCGGGADATLGAMLDAEGVPHRPIPVADPTRENLTVLDASSGEQYRFTMPGPHLIAEDVAHWLAAVERMGPEIDYLVLSGSVPPGVDDDIYARFVEVVPDSCRVLLDTSGRPLKAALRKGIHLIKPNLRELSQVLGRELGDDADIVAGCRELIGKEMVAIAVVTLGKAGAVVVQGESHVHLRSPTVAIKSRVGAGDSTMAGIALGLDRGWDVPEAIKLGVAAGAAAVMTPGNELCRPEDVERLRASID